MDPIKLKRRREKKQKAKYQAEMKQERAQKRVKSLLITINWYKNRYWGNCPRASVNVEFKDGSSTYRDGYGATGCGYDKESTVIAAIWNDFIKYKLYRKRPGEKPYGCSVFNKGDKWGPHFDGGVGTSCYYKIADYIGGKFENVEGRKTSDVFKYTDKRAPGRKLPAEADPFGPLKGLMALGALMADTPEQKNRNRKAALSTQPGISFPEDWDTLDEKEKSRRLDGLETVLK